MSSTNSQSQYEFRQIEKGQTFETLHDYFNFRGFGTDVDQMELSNEDKELFRALLSYGFLITFDNITHPLRRLIKNKDDIVTAEYDPNTKAIIYEHSQRAKKANQNDVKRLEKIIGEDYSELSEADKLEIAQYGLNFEELQSVLEASIYFYLLDTDSTLTENEAAKAAYKKSQNLVDGVLGLNYK